MERHVRSATKDVRCVNEYGHFFKYMPDSAARRSVRYLTVHNSGITFGSSSLLRMLVVVKLTVHINSRVEHKKREDPNRHLQAVVGDVLEAQLGKTKKVQKDQKEPKVERKRSKLSSSSSSSIIVLIIIILKYIYNIVTKSIERKKSERVGLIFIIIIIIIIKILL